MMSAVNVTILDLCIKIADQEFILSWRMTIQIME